MSRNTRIGDLNQQNNPVPEKVGASMIGNRRAGWNVACPYIVMTINMSHT